MGFTAKRRQAGTTLVEILVVIVIFLIGILAVVQIFPRGLRILVVSRNNSMATALGRDEIERLKDNPDRMPEAVLPVRYVGAVPQVINTVDPQSLNPLGDAILSDGSLTNGGAGTQNWMLASGPNVARRIIGEGQRVPSPRQVGGLYGGLMVLDHGPVAPQSPILAYANDLTRNAGAPRDAVEGAAYPYAVQAMSADGSTALGTLDAAMVATPVATVPYEYFVVGDSLPTARLYLPTSAFGRGYRVSLSGYVTVNGGYAHRDWITLNVFVAAPPQGTLLSSPLISISVAQLLAQSGQLTGGQTFVSAEGDTVRVAPQYRAVAASDPFLLGDPFEMRVLDASLGVLLFSPSARDGVVARPGGASEPLMAKVDYDVLDWRIIREEFRVKGDNTMQLALQSLKVGSENGPDGLPNRGIPILEPVPTANGDLNGQGGVNGSATVPTDNFVVVDLTTGGIVDEGKSDNPTFLLNKSRGTLSFVRKIEGQTVADINVPVLAPRPSGMTLSNVKMTGRPVRVLYRAKNEWSVQLLKSASRYAAVNSFQVGPGQYLVGTGDSGTRRNRVYFPASEVGNKITIDRIYYHAQAGGAVQLLEGQDFTIRAAAATEPVNLPYIDLTEVLPGMEFVFNTTPGNTATPALQPVSGVKGASVAVRVLWNPDSFTLTPNGVTNLARQTEWQRGYRRSVTQTYLRAEETR